MFHTPAFRYQLADQKKSLISYYIILSAIYIILFSFISLSISSIELTSPAGSTSLGGMEIATVIYGFIAGYSSLKDSFGILMQNGVSRKSIFSGHCSTILTLALIMAVIGKVINLIFKALSLSKGDAFTYNTLYEQSYFAHNTGMGSLSFHIGNFIFDFLLYLASMAAGFLLALIYYRLTRLGKYILNISVPVTLFVLIPTLDIHITDGRISKGIVDILDFAFGATSVRPINAQVTFALLSILFSVFGWLLLKRATIKD